ncbi:MAG: hypothetical protein AB7P34_10670 [Vicinamibacterales bacterium]
MAISRASKLARSFRITDGRGFRLALAFPKIDAAKRKELAAARAALDSVTPGRSPGKRGRS